MPNASPECHIENPEQAPVYFQLVLKDIISIFKSYQAANVHLSTTETEQESPLSCTHLLIMVGGFLSPLISSCTILCSRKKIIIIIKKSLISIQTLIHKVNIMVKLSPIKHTFVLLEKTNGTNPKQQIDHKYKYLLRYKKNL